MKIHKKRYADLFDKKYADWACDPELVSGESMEYGEYVNRMRGVIKKFSDDCLEAIVKFHWLRDKFRYRGRKGTISSGKKMVGGSDYHVYGAFMKWYVGRSGNLISKDLRNWAIGTYLKDWFPDLLTTGDPFVQDYKFPYEYITLEGVLLVAWMDERIELLAYGESMKMTYPQFVNYVSNYINCENEETGVQKYTISKAYRRVCNLPVVIKNEEIYEVKTTHNNKRSVKKIPEPDVPAEPAS